MRELQEAINLAIKHRNKKNFLFGCIAKRSDGVYVRSVNHDISGEPLPSGHAEARVLRKAGTGSILWVARIAKDNKTWAMAKPCRHCRALIKNRGVKRVYYTIGPNEWGIWIP